MPWARSPSVSPPYSPSVSSLAGSGASPRSSCSNSVAIHAVDLFANCAAQQDESRPESAPVYKGCGKSLNVIEFSEGCRYSVKLVYNEVPLAGHEIALEYLIALTGGSSLGSNLEEVATITGDKMLDILKRYTHLQSAVFSNKLN